MTEYIKRVDALKAATLAELDAEFVIEAIHRIPAVDVRPVPPGGIGEMSDGYHTFDALYHQRLILFAALVKAYKQLAWKSYRHEDGELCFGGGWFIVGIDTPCGSYTYHYENKDFDLFDCKELPNAKRWDGHTDKDVTRLLSLPDVRPVVRGRWELNSKFEICENCTVCGCAVLRAEYDPILRHGKKYSYCPNCGADMRQSEEPENLTYIPPEERSEVDNG